MYSRVYKHKYGKNEFRFRYNLDEHKLECVCKPSKEMVEEMREEAENCKLDWKRIEAMDNLKSYDETGYIVLMAEGLGEEGWKESRDYYMDMMSEDIMCMCGGVI